jgi:hypothetical protein
MMHALFWIVAAVYWLLAIWSAAIARWIRTGRRSELADILGGEDAPRWIAIEHRLDDAAETLTFNTLVFEVIFLLSWLGGWTNAAAPGWLTGDTEINLVALGIGACVGLALLWIGPIAIAAALAKYVGAAMTAQSRLTRSSNDSVVQICASTVGTPRLKPSYCEALSNSSVKAPLTKALQPCSKM